MGLVLVAAVGSGALPGVRALGLHSVGMVGNLFAEAPEQVDPRPAEAARAAGATELQVAWCDVFPQALPRLAEVSIRRWEYNVRAVVDLLGARLRRALR